MTIQELYANIGGSYDSAKKILQMDRLIGKFIVKFLDDKSCEKLMTGWENRDGAAIFEGAHALKGVCANLGLDSLSQNASEIAEEYRGGKAPSLAEADLETRMQAIRQQHEETVRGIQAYVQAQ